MTQEQKETIVYEFDLGKEKVDFIIGTVDRVRELMNTHFMYSLVSPDNPIISKMRHISVDAMFFLLMETDVKHDVMTVDQNQFDLLVDIFTQTLEFITAQILSLKNVHESAKEDIKKTLDLTYRDKEFIDFAGDKLQEDIDMKIKHFENLAMDVAKAKNLIVQPA